jgi:hypothetical protein
MSKPQEKPGIHDRLHIALADITDEWLVTKDKTINDAIGEAFIFMEHLRVNFELATCQGIRDRQEKAARMQQGARHEHE